MSIWVLGFSVSKRFFCVQEMIGVFRVFKVGVSNRGEEFWNQAIHERSQRVIRK